MMRKIIFLSGFFLIFNLASAREVADQIVARVNGINILKSDLEKPRIGNNAKPYTLDQLIMEEILYQKAADPKAQVLPTKAEIDRQITAMKIANNLDEMHEEEFEKQLKEEGFTLDEYRNQLARILASEKVKHLEINEKLVITSQQVEDYFKKNPEYSKEACWIKIADVPAEIADKKIDKEKLKWEDLGWINKSEVAPDLAFVFDMKKDEISKPVKRDDQLQIIWVVDKKNRRLKTLEERYVDIERKLQNDKRHKLEHEFEDEIKKESTIVYL
ncbi:MAG: SurA N-terminal domain-containing protein [bacterium]